MVTVPHYWNFLLTSVDHGPYVSSLRNYEKEFSFFLLLVTQTRVARSAYSNQCYTFCCCSLTPCAGHELFCARKCAILIQLACERGHAEILIEMHLGNVFCTCI